MVSGPLDLEALTTDIDSLQPEFNLDITEYALTVENEVDSIEIIAALADENASMTINGDSGSSGSIGVS
ncbi:MAG: cadherin-like beta sandwich domain-containing protein [bacterium]